MQYNLFQGEPISKLGFGLMRLPVLDGDQAKIDYAKTEQMILYALEQGVNYFDTAYPYHRGESEKVFGQIMKNNGIRNQLHLATKLFTANVDKPDYDPRKILEEQLSRLQTDHFDFYLLHALNAERWKTLRDQYHIREFLTSLKRDGTVRHIGFSFHDDYDAFVSILNDFDGWEFAQIQYNYADHELQAGDAGMRYAREKGIPLVIMEPIKGGNLAFTDYPEVGEILKKHGLADISAVELALDYVFDKPNLLTVLSGMGSMEMIRENIAIASRAQEGMLNENMSAAIEEICALVERTETIGCTACRYCMEGCPAQLRIPDAFDFYNTAKKYRSPSSQRRMYDMLCNNLADCVECGQCASICPQHLDIPELLKKVRSYME